MDVAVLAKKSNNCAKQMELAMEQIYARYKRCILEKKENI